MKLSIRSFLLLAVLFIFTGAENAAYALSQGASAEAVGPRHLRYYGYYASAMSGVGTGNYMSDVELTNHTNFIFIQAAGDELLSKLKQAKGLNKKVMLGLHWHLFDPDMKLRADYQEQWRSLVPLLKSFEGNLLAFYPADEPFWLGKLHGQSSAQMLQSLETVGRMIKADFPSVPVSMIEAWTMLDDKLKLPASFDWFGFDCYNAMSTFERCGDPEYGFKSIPSYLNFLKTKVLSLNAADRGSRRLMLVPMAMRPLHATFPETQIAKILQQYADLGEQEPLVVALVPFIWQTFADATGARELPAVKAQSQLIGWSILKSVGDEQTKRADLK